ncbi:hypothetical protein [Photobacterium leiognathi]|nr:hypothetical protein [Photobacterium leiognathi]
MVSKHKLYISFGLLLTLIAGVDSNLPLAIFGGILVATSAFLLA